MEYLQSYMASPLNVAGSKSRHPRGPRGRRLQRGLIAPRQAVGLALPIHLEPESVRSSEFEAVRLDHLVVHPHLVSRLYPWL